VAVEGVADITRGEDEIAAAEVAAELGQVAGRAGARDVAEGVETLEVAEEVGVVASLAAAVTFDDLERGMVLAAMSGQLRVASDIVDLMRMPVLTAFLRQKSYQLRGLAVNEIGRAMAAAAVAEDLESLRDRLAGLGLAEVGQGMEEFAAADALAEASGEMAVAGVEKAATGVAEVAAARAAGGVARRLAAEGVAEVAVGSAEVGAGVGAEATLEATKRPRRAKGKKG